MSSTFDADSFLNQQTDESMSTRMDPVPEGDYHAVIKDVGLRESGEYKILDISWDLVSGADGGDLDALQSQLGRQNITVRQSLFLDINEVGGLDVGPNKNIRLGRLREILGQNKSGAPWSPRMLEGAGPVVVRVTQRPDKNDDSIIYNDVGRFAAVGS